MLERTHIIEVLKETEIALKQEDFFKIKELSNQVIHTASIDQDPDIISIAVIIYSLGKLIQRNIHLDFKSWPNFYKKYLVLMNDSIKDLEENNIDRFRKDIDSLRKMIDEISGSIKNYIQDVFRKAQINKASMIYEHGISMEKTARILGISLWELAEYTGQKQKVKEDLIITMDISDRINLVKEAFIS